MVIDNNDNNNNDNGNSSANNNLGQQKNIPSMCIVYKPI